MPTASDELRAYWGGADDDPPMRHLESRGYKLTRKWTWIPPKGVEMSERDYLAIRFLIDEWDMGGIEKEPSDD